MGVLCLVYLILALRTNVVFVLIFFLLIIAFGCLTGAFWHLGNAYADPRSAADPTFAIASELAIAGRCLVAGGAFAFLVCLCGWWIFVAIMLAALDFPFQIPGKFSPVPMRDCGICANAGYTVGDLSHLIRGASEKAQAQAESVNPHSGA